ncbi:hypothetical protein [uncultured Mediterranean phage uvMED]|nr:hypothetical protein [uncultured Mediterranean phage uvMED]
MKEQVICFLKMMTRMKIDGVDKDTANKLKDKVRERLRDERLPRTESNEERKV